jgi:hypothetical protein
MSKHLDELVDGLVSALSVALARNGLRPGPDVLRMAVREVTEDWSVTRKDYPHRDDHPLAESRYGHQLVAALPFVPETDTEREDRQAWIAAQRWTQEAIWYSWDPQDPGWDDDELGPPPQRVGAAQLLQQGIWWRMRTSEDEFAPTAPIRIEHMDHEHRLALLAFLRRNAGRYKLRADWAMASGPQPSGDMACDAFERECDQLWGTPAAEWIEDQPLVQALVYWTTPYAEAPLTWRPMDEAPRDGTEIVVRLRDADEPDEPDRAWWSRTEYCWHLSGGSGSFDDGAFTEWRELRDDEIEAITLAEHENALHVLAPEPHRCSHCRADVAEDMEDAL